MDDDTTLQDPLLVLDKDMIVYLFTELDAGIFTKAEFIQLMRAEMRAAGAQI